MAAHEVTVIVALEMKQRYFAAAPIRPDDMPVAVLWGTGDDACRHRLFWRYDCATPSRALELAAYDCAARCIDPLALEVTG
jgi:hypothetical protein